VLAGARAVVTGNTGPAHLAAAVGTPVVSLFAPVVPAVRWMPYGVPVVLLGDQDAACRGSRAQVCPVPGHPCLSRVTPVEALTACLRLVTSGDEALSTPPGPQPDETHDIYGTPDTHENHEGAHR
jgi:ADP-heptose:LPS heptosyltransferase